MLPDFIHIPRTGGTAVAQAFDYPSPREQHKPASAYGTLNKPWTIVRNPFHRAVSLCAFINRQALARDDRLLGYADMLFWLDNKCAGPRGENMLLYRRTEYEIHVAASMCEFFTCCNLANEISPIVFRYERLGDDWGLICRHVGKSVPYPAELTTQVSRRGAYEDCINEEVRQMIVDRYIADFRVFGYSTHLDT